MTEIEAIKNIKDLIISGNSRFISSVRIDKDTLDSYGVNSYPPFDDPFTEAAKSQLADEFAKFIIDKIGINLTEKIDPSPSINFDLEAVVYTREQLKTVINSVVLVTRGNIALFKSVLGCDL